MHLESPTTVNPYPPRISRRGKAQSNTANCALESRDGGAEREKQPVFNTNHDNSLQGILRKDSISAIRRL